MKKLTILCPRCGGCGLVPLGQELLDTLTALKARRGKQASAPELYEKMPGKEHFSPTAINQRLEDLRALGLVTRERRGRVFVYKA